MIKVFNKQELVEERIKNMHTTSAAIFSGSMDDNRKAEQAGIIKEFLVPMKNAKWEGSDGYFRLWNEIKDLQTKVKNAAQAPSASDLSDLVGKLFIDFTRRTQEAPDLTSRIATEQTNYNFAEIINLRDILPYVGFMKTISGSNDSVPLIEQFLGTVDTATMVSAGMGWKDSLKNLLYNSLHNMQKVSQAVVDANTDYRNSKVAGAIIGATYVASQKQAKDETAANTRDEKIWTTLYNGIKKLRDLKDTITGRKINVPRISWLGNSSNTWDIMRVIGGKLDINGAAGTRGNNRQALPINEILEYDRGITDGFTWGKDTLSFPGVTAGKGYLFVPLDYAYVMTKRPLTMETGRGSVLQLSTEEKAWYRVQTEYMKRFLGSSFTGTTLGASYGAVIEVSLPD